MQRDIEYKNFDAPENVKQVLDQLISKLEKSTSTFPEESVYVRLMVEENSARSLYNISLTLDVPGKTLAAKEEQHDLQAGIREIFTEIERQQEKYKANLRRERPRSH